MSKLFFECGDQIESLSHEVFLFSAKTGLEVSVPSSQYHWENDTMDDLSFSPEFEQLMAH